MIMYTVGERQKGGREGETEGEREGGGKERDRYTVGRLDIGDVPDRWNLLTVTILHEHKISIGKKKQKILPSRL